MRRSAGLLLLPFGLILSSCGQDAPATPSLLTGFEWRLRSIQGADAIVQTIAEPERFTVVFAEADQLQIRADCNRCAATYALTGNVFRVGGPACTKAFCAQTAPLDTRYVSVLGAARSLAVRERELTVVSDLGVLNLGR